MAGPLAEFATEAEQSLHGLRALTEDPGALVREIDTVLATVSGLRTGAKNLGENARPELLAAIDTKLASVRRAAEVFKGKALSYAPGQDHQYLIDLSELAGYLAEKLNETAHYFGDEVARRSA